MAIAHIQLGNGRQPPTRLPLLQAHAQLHSLSKGVIWQKSEKRVAPAQEQIGHSALRGDW